MVGCGSVRRASLCSSWPHMTGLKVWERESSEGHSHVYWLMPEGLKRLKAETAGLPGVPLYLHVIFPRGLPSRVTQRCPADSHMLGDLNSTIISHFYESAWLNLVLCSGSLKVAVKMLAGLHSHLETQLGENILISSFGKFPWWSMAKTPHS